MTSLHKCASCLLILTAAAMLFLATVDAIHPNHSLAHLVEEGLRPPGAPFRPPPGHLRPPLSSKRPPLPVQVTCKSYSWKEGNPYSHNLRCNETHRFCCGECSRRYCCDDQSKEVQSCEPDSSNFLNTMVWIVCVLVIFTMCMLLLLIAKMKINRNVRNIENIPAFQTHTNRYRRANMNSSQGMPMNVFQCDDMPPSYDTLSFKEAASQIKLDKNNELTTYDQLQTT